MKIDRTIDEKAEERSHATGARLFPMLMKVVDIHCRSDSESDYDTAVDMSHWSLQAQTTLLETAIGVHLAIEETHTSVTHSYLEPDFDLIESGGDVIYLSHADRSKDSDSSSYSVEVIMPTLIPEISSKDFAELEYARSVGFNCTLSGAVEYFLFCTEWNDASVSNSRAIKLSDEELEALLSSTRAIKTRWKGLQIKMPLPPGVVEKLREAEVEMLDICMANSRTRIHNNCEQAKFELGEMSRVALLELQSSWE